MTDTFQIFMTEAYRVPILTFYLNNAIFFTHISERLVIKYARHSFKGTVWTTLRAVFFMN